jgi:hypothetical protein
MINLGYYTRFMCKLIIHMLTHSTIVLYINFFSLYRSHGLPMENIVFVASGHPCMSPVPGHVFPAPSLPSSPPDNM